MEESQLAVLLKRKPSSQWQQPHSAAQQSDWHSTHPLIVQRVHCHSEAFRKLGLCRCVAVTVLVIGEGDVVLFSWESVVGMA
jgi:hypothetical protein